MTKSTEFGSNPPNRVRKKRWIKTFWPVCGRYRNRLNPIGVLNQAILPNPLPYTTLPQLQPTLRTSALKDYVLNLGKKTKENLDKKTLKNWGSEEMLSYLDPIKSPGFATKEQYNSKNSKILKQCCWTININRIKWENISPFTG